MTLTQSHLDRLVCPICHGPLLLGADSIVCGLCTRRFPIVDGLPVLIASRAVLQEPW